MRFCAERFEGELISSEEGEMHWVKAAELSKIKTVGDFDELLQVILDDHFNEFQYVVEDGGWKVVLK